MSGRGRILYVSHDSASPSGGVRVLYAHVGHLTERGFAAFIVHSKSGYRPSWFDAGVPTMSFEGDLQLDPDDIVVLPEDHRVALEAFARVPVRKIVFCQNHYYVFSGLGEHRSWAELGIERALCCSTVIQGFLESVLGFPRVALVHNAIDLDRFRPRPKVFQIATMPRKAPFEASYVQGLFRSLYGDVPGWSWVVIDKVPEGRVAELMGASSVFLSLSRYEGFGLPPLEAMASGCVVTGFRGDGGREYASTENGFWCDEGDLVGCTQALKRAVDSVAAGGEPLEQMHRASSQTAATYTPQRQGDELEAFFNDLGAKRPLRGGK